jgi:hypothetical protein
MFFARFADESERVASVAAEGAIVPEERGDDRESISEAISGALTAGLLGWGVSLMLHAGVVLLGVFVVWSSIEQVNEEEVIIPIARLSEMPGTPIQVTTLQRNTQQSTARRSLSMAQSQSQTTLQTKVNTNTTLLGMTGGSAASAPSPIGATIADAASFQVQFFGGGGNAKKLVFLIDASGSLLDSLQFVIMELKKTINDLSEKQSFTVIFFQGDKIVEVPPAGLKKADAQTKQKVIEWIDLSSRNVKPEGRTDPVSALKQGLRYQPQLIFLLSDNITGRGKYEVDQRILLREIEKANTSRTKINTIQFIYPDPLLAAGMTPTMQLIAERTGGVYKFVDSSDLGR